jgi:hypothetical protein
VFDHGIHRFLVHIEAGEPSIADGMGILFNSLLPCKRNIPRLNSVFINRKGQLCSRINSDVRMIEHV